MLVGVAITMPLIIAYTAWAIGSSAARWQTKDTIDGRFPRSPAVAAARLDGSDLARRCVATPADWREGREAIIPPSVSDEDAKTRFPQGFTTLRPYLRTVKID